MTFNYQHVLNTLGGRRNSASSAASAPPVSKAQGRSGANGQLPGEDYLPPGGASASRSASTAPHSPSPYAPHTPVVGADSQMSPPGARSPRSPRSPTFSPNSLLSGAHPNLRGRARPSSPVLLHPLPPSLTLEKESKAQSELELDRQAQQRKREKELADALQDAQHRVERIQARENVGTWTLSNIGKGKGSASEAEPKKGAPFTRPPQAYELYQAIDKRDIDYIARVRDHSFELLLQKNAGEFPVIYASRWGESHRDVVILLVGAFSRYVNFLTEEEFKKKEVRNTLRMLRANLKLAIDNALLPTQKSNLLSSYLQVLIMSEGDAWVYRSTNDLGLLLRDPDSSPVAEAEGMVRKFSTKELRGVPGGIGDVEEYIANAALDLVIMAAWSVAAGQIGAEPLPTYTFARDLRTYSLFVEALGENNNSAKLPKLSRRLRYIINQLEALAGDTRKGVRGRLRDVKEAIDRPASA